MSYSLFLQKIRQHVVQYFKSNENQKLVYHNLAHTEAVVFNASKIAGHYQLGDKETFIVITAAWFHDTGYFNGDPGDHEIRGADIAARFLKEIGIDDETILAVRKCIIATRMPQSPQNLPEQIVCDADLYHFGTDYFPERNKLMRKEAESCKGKKIPKDVWRKSTVLFMEAHHYQTDYCRQLLQDKKNQNLKALKQKGDIKEEKSTGAALATIPLQKMESEAANSKKQKIDRPERGIETMFRISSNNHQRLSDMADNKAHIMITTTSIIISVLLSLLLRKLEDNPQLIIPTMLLLAICVITMVFCILATRPNLPPGTFTQQDLDTRKVNLLFFGNFYKMSFEEYDAGMKQMMNDRDFLYGSLTKDVYSQGIVLGRKYSLLRKGYNVFMYGIIASVIAFFVASVFFR
ncbi:MAG: Pycsar system effector family protein [Chitinophagaceae bacterium]